MSSILVSSIFYCYFIAIAIIASAAMINSLQKYYSRNINQIKSKTYWWQLLILDFLNIFQDENAARNWIVITGCLKNTMDK